MNLEKLTDLFTSLSPLKINNEYCTKSITPRSSCNKCIEVCPKQSLSFKKGRWQIDDCIYCGLCVTACPNSVFQLEEDYLLSQCSPNKHLALTCTPMLEQVKEKNSDVLKVNCLAQLYPELFLKLVNHSEKLTMLLDKEKCLTCLKFNIDDLLKQVQSFPLPSDKLVITNNPKEFKPLKSLKTRDKQEPANGRRLFFRSIFQGSKELPQHFIDSVLSNLPVETETDITPTTAANTKKIHIKRKHTYDLLKTNKNIQPTRLLPYKKLTASNCNFCGACLNLCPTNALTLKEAGATKHLLFNPQLCTQCNICTDICLFQGIAWGKELTVENFISEKPYNLVSATKKECSNCGQDFWEIPEANNCVFCKKVED